MIPKIDVRSQIAKKEYAGELSFEYDAPDLIEIPYVEFTAPVKVSLHYEIFEDNTVEVKGRISFTLKGACSRCLSETERSFTEEVNAVFEPNGGDGETYGYMHRVDLQEFLRDSVAFALPSVLLCGECEIPDGEQE